MQIIQKKQNESLMWSLAKKLGSIRSEGKNDLGKTLKKSLWHYFNPTITHALKKISALVKKSKRDDYVLGIVHLENMASIIFSYGDAISIAKTTKIQPIIKKFLGRNATVLRVGIDEFLYVCHYVSEQSYTKRVEDVSREIRRYGAKIQGTPIFFSFKIGAAFLHKDGELYTALDNAFIALHECRNTDTMAHSLFSQISDKMLEYKEQMKMAAFFQNVINNNRLQLAYQPVISSKTGKVKSYEALLRVIHEDGSIESAGPYIAIAEKYGYITEVDHYVLRAVVKDLQANDSIQIGLNVSNLTIDDPSWLEEAKILMQDPKLAERVIIEITETGVQRQTKKTISFVESVQALGCQVAIDDFGAGYTSFTQLKVLNVDILKIDGAFIKDIHANPDNQLFVKTLLEFAKAFGIKTVAEFVESGEIAKVLIDMGVDYLQGYYFDKPLTNRPWVTEDK